MRLRFALMLLPLLAGAASLPPQDAAQRVAWNQPAAPFRVIGNVYYVGTAGLAAYLVVDPKGMVLIDGGLPESAPRIAANIRSLGFEPRDVRVLLVNHSHFDHAGGLAALRRLTGAQLVASAGDAGDLRTGATLGRPELARFPAVAVDRVVRDGARVRIGATTLVANLTPGHTRGCTSWGLRTVESGRAIDVLFACSLTVAGQPLVGNRAYPDAAADFRWTYARLRSMRADVFLNFHPEFFDLAGKRRRLEAGDAFAFLDPGELGRQVARAERGFEEALAREMRR